MSLPYSGCPWMPRMWSPTQNISTPVFSEKPITSAPTGTCHTCWDSMKMRTMELYKCSTALLRQHCSTSSWWHSMIKAEGGVSPSRSKSLGRGMSSSTMITFLIPTSQPPPALATRPPNARHITCKSTAMFGINTMHETVRRKKTSKLRWLSTWWPKQIPRTFLCMACNVWRRKHSLRIHRSLP